MKSFAFLRLAALRARLPALAPAEKSALALLFALLASGAALRAWQNSGVSFGPVDDWAGLRALVTRARLGDPAPWPCSEPEAGWNLSGGEKKPARAKTKKEGKAAGKKAPAGLVDLNAAGERQLLSLPGIGPSTAKAILAHRAANGPFAAPEALLGVKGIGPKKFEALRPWIKVAGTRRAVPAESTGAARPQPPQPRPDSVSRDAQAPP